MSFGVQTQCPFLGKFFLNPPFLVAKRTQANFVFLFLFRLAFTSNESMKVSALSIHPTSKTET